LAGNGYIRVSWVTTFKMATSVVEYGTTPGQYEEYTAGDTFGYHYYSYSSGKIHYATIGPLESDTTYYYRCSGTGPEYSFKTPPAAFPAEFVVVGKSVSKFINLVFHCIYSQNYYTNSSIGKNCETRTPEFIEFKKTLA